MNRAIPNPTIKVNDTPSAQMISEASKAVKIVDEKGRAITLRKPGVLAQFRLIEALGETARNDVYVRMALPLLYVHAIDDDQLLPLQRKSDVEALIQRLSDEGMAAVMTGVSEHFGGRTPEGDKATLGN
jgi:hypothetical protein